MPYRIKEEPSAEIQFPVLDENDEVIEAERFLQLEGKSVNWMFRIFLGEEEVSILKLT